MQQNTNFKILTRSDKRICLKESDGERVNEGADQFHTGTNTEEKLVPFRANQTFKADVTIISTHPMIYITLHYNTFKFL
jgi:hypothetical protein